MTPRQQVQWGINIFSAVPSTDASGHPCLWKTMTQECIDVAVKNPQVVTVELNNLLGKQSGVADLGSGLVDASNNWVGCILGPTLAPGRCSTDSGSAAAIPWLLTPAPTQPKFSYPEQLRWVS